MATPNDEILITGSRNLDDDTNSTDKNISKETDKASKRTLEKEGIFIENENAPVEKAKPRDEFSRELEDMSGIEIIPEDSKD